MTWASLPSGRRNWLRSRRPDRQPRAASSVSPRYRTAITAIATGLTNYFGHIFEGGSYYRWLAE